MKKAVTLKENWEFRRLYNKGKSAVGPAVVVYCKKSKNEQNRLGVTVSTKLGGAVVRNRARRRLREVYRLASPHLKKGYDFVLVARSKAVDGSFSAMQENFERLCKKLGVWEDEA